MARTTAVSLDTSRVVNMLNALARNTQNVDLRDEGKKLAATVRLQQTPRTGKLESSIKVVGHGSSVKVVSDVFYARFNWRGTKHQPAKPPTVEYHPQELAQEVARQIFWTPSGGFGTTPSA